MRVFFVSGSIKSHFVHLEWARSVKAKILNIEYIWKRSSLLEKVKQIYYLKNIRRQTIIARKIAKEINEPDKNLLIIENVGLLPLAYTLRKICGKKRIHIISIVPDNSFHPKELSKRRYFYDIFKIRDTIDCYISVSETIKKFMINYGIEEDRIFVVRPFSILNVSKREVEKKIKRKVITFIKNYPRSNPAKIILSLSKKLPDFKFNMVGTVCKNIRNLPENINCYVDISWNKLKEILLKSSIYLHPVYFDAFSVAVIDAMRCGNYPLVYRLVGASEVLDEENVFYSLDENEIIEKIIYAYEKLSEKDFIKYHKIGMKFSKENGVKEFRKVLKKIVRRI